MSSSGTQAPSRWAIFGLVERPPPTQTSNPGPCSGCTTPTNETSLTSCATSCCHEIAVLNLRGRLENSGLPTHLSRIVVDGRARVDGVVGVDPGDGRAEDDARGVAAGLRRAHVLALQALPDRGHVDDVDPVVLDVLPVGDVGGVARVGLADLAEGAQLAGGERPAVDAHAQHEVAVVELLGLQHGGAAAVDAGLALGVEAPPPHASAQVGGVDGVEPALGVDVLDAGADVQPVVVLLGALVRVERFAVAELPLAFAALALHSRGGQETRLSRGSGDVRAGDGSATERAAHPVQVDVTAPHEHEVGQRRGHASRVPPVRSVGQRRPHAGRAGSQATRLSAARRRSPRCQPSVT